MNDILRAIIPLIGVFFGLLAVIKFYVDRIEDKINKIEEKIDKITK